MGNQAQNTQDGNDSKISLAEGIIVVTLSATGDAADIVAILALPIPVVGLVVTSMAKVYSYFIFALLMLWAALRSTKGGMAPANKIVSMFFGKVGDEVTSGLAPIQTMTLIVMILVNNNVKISTIEKGLGSLSVRK